MIGCATTDILRTWGPAARPNGEPRRPDRRRTESGRSHGWPTFRRWRMPYSSNELGLSLKYAQGVRDPDFRHSGIAPFEPGFTIGVTDRDLESLDPSPDRTRLRERLKQDNGNRS
ncbi:hypothetical protein NYO67_2658 [Aspergillus flavus]|nr:hypothetical protein NYO67_2658 [Aspergillus flavus]